MVKRRVRTHANPLKRFDELSTPDWKAVFADPALPFAIEFGSSKGEFLIAHAALYPGTNILGTEIRKPLVMELEIKIREMNLTNAHVVYGNIAGRLRDFTPLGRLDAVFVFFPDPWPKTRHHKRRVLQPRLLDEISEIMPSGGTVDVMTDHEGLRDDVMSVFSARDDFVECEPRDLPEKSGWQEHCELTGRPYWRFSWNRAS